MVCDVTRSESNVLLCHGTWCNMQSCAVKWKFVFYLRLEVSAAMRNFIVISCIMTSCSLVGGYLLVGKPLARLHDQSLWLVLFMISLTPF
jgi:hypothetical protein